MGFYFWGLEPSMQVLREFLYQRIRQSALLYSFHLEFCFRAFFMSHTEILQVVRQFCSIRSSRKFAFCDWHRVSSSLGYEFGFQDFVRILSEIRTREEMLVAGLHVVENFLTHGEEQEILSELPNLPFSSQLQNRGKIFSSTIDDIQLQFESRELSHFLSFELPSRLASIIRDISQEGYMMSSEALYWKHSDFNDFQSWSWPKGSKLGAHRDGVENQKEPISIITLGNMKKFGLCNYELEVLDRIPKKNGKKVYYDWNDEFYSDINFGVVSNVEHNLLLELPPRSLLLTFGLFRLPWHFVDAADDPYYSINYRNRGKDFEWFGTSGS